MRHVRTGVAMVVFLVAVAFLAVRVTDRTPSDETPLERAYRLCGQCGLGTDEVDQLIDDVGHSVLTRDELVELWRATYADSGKLEEARELCGPCVDAVLEAAGG